MNAKKSTSVQSQKTYFELLKDPRWQKKRLKIMERDEFTCQSCGDDKTTLNVHHLAYRKDTNIWDYEDEELVTQCENCHKYISQAVDASIELIRRNARHCEQVEMIYKINNYFDELSIYELSLINDIIKHVFLLGVSLNKE